MKNKPTLFEKVYEHYKTTRPRKFPKAKITSRRVVKDSFQSKAFKRHINKSKSPVNHEVDGMTYENIFGEE